MQKKLHFLIILNQWVMQGCVFTRDINKAILISDAMETGTVQINSAPARGPDHFPFQVHSFSLHAKLFLKCLDFNFNINIYHFRMYF